VAQGLRSGVVKTSLEITPISKLATLGVSKRRDFVNGRPSNVEPDQANSGLLESDNNPKVAIDRWDSPQRSFCFIFYIIILLQSIFCAYDLYLNVLK